MRIKHMIYLLLFINTGLKAQQKDKYGRIMRMDGLLKEVTQTPYYGYSVLTGMSISLGTETGGLFFEQDTVRNSSRLSFSNQDLSSIYQILLYATKPAVIKEELIKDASKTPYIPHFARRILEVKDLSRFRNDSQMDQAVWNRKNLFCYEMEQGGLISKQELAKKALSDLNNRLKLNGRYEMRKMKCLVFIKTDKPLTDTLPQGKGGMSVPVLVLYHLDRQQRYPPAINETGLGFDVEFNMLPDDGTIAGFRKEMQRHGLDLIEAEREIEVLVISDK